MSEHALVILNLFDLLSGLAFAVFHVCVVCMTNVHQSTLLLSLIVFDMILHEANSAIAINM